MSYPLRLSTAKYDRYRRNVNAMHKAVDGNLRDADKYGAQPWGAFYHFMAMELAAFATGKQLDFAIQEALRMTEAHEAGIRNVRLKP